MLITEMEHHSNIVPWQILCEETGAKLRYLTLTGSHELSLDELDAVLAEGSRSRTSRTCSARSTRWARSRAGRARPGR